MINKRNIVHNKTFNIIFIYVELYVEHMYEKK
jgi:hypothetical protein